MLETPHPSTPNYPPLPSQTTTLVKPGRSDSP